MRDCKHCEHFGYEVGLCDMDTCRKGTVGRLEVTPVIRTDDSWRMAKAFEWLINNYFGDLKDEFVRWVEDKRASVNGG